MNLLRPIIDVRELPPNYAKARSSFPSIRSLVSEQSHPEEANILRYLQQGIFGCFYPDPGLERDVIELGTMVERCLPVKSFGVSPSVLSARIEPSSVLTDGVWLWPGVLSYYLAKYHLAVDPEFVEHARAKNWTIRESDVQLESLSFEAFTTMDRWADQPHSASHQHESSISG